MDSLAAVRFVYHKCSLKSPIQCRTPHASPYRILPKKSLVEKIPPRTFHVPAAFFCLRRILLVALRFLDTT